MAVHLLVRQQHPYMTDPPNRRSDFTAGPDAAIGRAGEPRVLGITADLLRAAGHDLQPRPSRDSQGEDAVIRIQGIDYTVQATTVPDAPDFWRQARQGSTLTQATIKQTSAWLDRSIDKKVEGMSAEQRARTVLVLDVHNWGDRLAQPAVVNQLRSADSNAARKHGLAGVVVAGSSPSSSTLIVGKLR
jgi:hypothetical protein